MIVSFCRCSGLFAVLIGLMLISVACFNSETSSSIAFVSEIDGDAEIFLLEPKSGNTTRITSNGGSDVYPSWSPDRTKIAYLSDQSGNYKVYIANPSEGVINRMLVDSDIRIEPLKPIWSPDGSMLSFSASSDGDTDLYLADVNVESRQDATRITFNPGAEHLGGWSPDGEWVVFHSLGLSEYQGIWIRNPKGVNSIRLTDKDDRDAKWSPKGDRIVFTRYGKDGQTRICLLVVASKGDWSNSGESNPDERCLTDTAENSRSPMWAPSGELLAYVSSVNGTMEIFTMDSEGLESQQKTTNSVDDLYPVWAPDGKEIAFISYLYGLGEIIILDVSDGTHNRLTENDAQDHSHNW